jgi:peroxiredoxin Q/BCP
MTIHEGQSAPPFSLPDHTGRPVALADFRGRQVIIYFYPKDDTPGCTQEAQAFRDLWAPIQAAGAVVIGISPDSQASHARFRAKHGLPFILLADPELRVLTAYGAFGEKTLYGKKTRGVIRSTVWVGPDGTIRKHWPKVARAAEHPAKVLAALQAEAAP